MATRNSDVAGLQHRLSVEAAENLSGIRKWQVSRWRTRLEEPEKYRLLILVFLGPFAQVIHNLSGAAEKGRS